MKRLIVIIMLIPFTLLAETKFTLNIVKQTPEQDDLWKLSDWMVDIDQLKLETTPFLSSSDIKSFSLNEGITDGLVLNLISLKEIDIGPAGMTYFVISIDGKRILLGQFISSFSSVRQPGILTTGIGAGTIVSKVNIPASCKELNVYIRELNNKKIQQDLQPAI